MADFAASKQYGLERVREISEAASIKLDLPPRALERYLTDNIHFDLDEENLAGLQLFFREGRCRRIDPARQTAGISARDCAFNRAPGRVTVWNASAR